MENPLPQHPLWADALARAGLRSGWRDGVLVQRRGPLAAAIRAPARDAGWWRRHGPLLVEPEGDGAPLRAAGYGQVMTGATLALLALGPPGDALPRASGKWRNRAVAGARAAPAPQVAPLPPDPGHWLLRQEAAQRRARRYRGLPHALILALAAGPAPPLLFRLGGRAPLAGMLFLRHGDAATYLLGWCGAAGRAVSGHHVLLAAAARHFAAEGATHLDLGTIDTGRAPGLARFKLGAGAAPRRLGGSWLRLRP
ncbi:GNAT family N-acetyltransferase [Wenxinia saemankumensis]|nr:GNAT family N-acetyltransferase [Wenxinia saemankumensis]